MNTIYHKLIEAESHIANSKASESQHQMIMLDSINTLNACAWYTEFSPKEFFEISGNKGRASYLYTSELIYKLAILYPDCVSQIQWPKFVCILSNDGFVTVTNKPFGTPTLEQILDPNQVSFITTNTKEEQIALAEQINATL